MHYYFNQGRPGLSGNYFIANTPTRSFEKIVELMVIRTYKSIFSTLLGIFSSLPDGRSNEL